MNHDLTTTISVQLAVGNLMPQSLLGLYEAP